MREDKLPLRTVLQNFINHVDTLEAKRSLGNDQYEVEFQELKQLTESLKLQVEYSCTEGEKDFNRRKNRYKDILPYDYSRVVLSTFPGVPGSDYINANFIRGASGSRAYIGSQGPLPHTVPDFWRMVVECEVQVIIMASNETEGGKHKCECYWVNVQGEERQFGNITVSFIKARQVCPDFIVRTLKINYITDGGNTEERTICQFHYVLWPDHGVPETVRPLLDMVRLVRDCQASETLPVLVHCSAGCGRTGTICAIDYVWGLLRAGRLTENLNLFGLVKEMRRQRVAMVQTREQYILLHRAVRELFKERLKVIDAHPYENIATDGKPLILREKENDYEELYLRPEKQDESAKPVPASTTTPSVAATQTDSLICYTHTKDFPEFSSPTATLDWLGSTVLPRHMKYTKPQQSSPSSGSHTPCQASPSHHTPLPQPSPLSPACAKAVVSSVPVPSPSQAQIGYVGAAQVHQLPTTSPQVLNSSPQVPNSSPQVLNSSPQVPNSSPQVLNFSPQVPQLPISSPQGPKVPGGAPVRTKPQPGPPPVLASSSKQEKEAENAAHKYKGVLNLLSSVAAASCPQDNTTAFQGLPALPHSPGHGKGHAAAYLALSGRLHQGEGVENSAFRHRGVLNSASPKGGSASTLPGTAARPCSPSVALSPPGQPQEGGGEADRRPSIAKLKELFERSSQEQRPPAARLSRSASSVTARPTALSLHATGDGGHRIKRKSSLGAEEMLATKKALEALEQRGGGGEGTSQAGPGTAAAAAAAPRTSPGQASPLEEGTSALLARVEERPALPVKKSKSFRYVRPAGAMGGRGGGTLPSPELGRKKVDINTYFSLDRCRHDGATHAPPHPAGADTPTGGAGGAGGAGAGGGGGGGGGSVSFLGDIPSPPEGFKLSVYQVPPVPGLARGEARPRIPPKKVIGEKLRSTRPLPPPGTPQHLPAPSASSPASSPSSPFTTSTHTPPLASPTLTSSTSSSSSLSSVHVHPSTTTATSSFSSLIYDYPRDPQGRPRRPQPGPPGVNHDPGGSPSPQQAAEPGGKDYVNARLVRQPQSCVYVPLPARRATLDGRPAREYANCAPSNQRPAESQAARPAEAATKFSVYDEVGPGPAVAAGAPEDVSAPAAGGPGKGVGGPGSGTGDYEVMDFGESSASVDEVFETVNYELLAAAAAARGGQTQGRGRAREGEGQAELEPSAQQVVHACHDYLQGQGADVQEVATRVAVAPQGLRTRERRNSYRQAVSPNWPQPAHQAGHKYETIWFDGARRVARDGTERGRGPPSEEAPCGVGEDLQANLDQCRGSKERLFREKLEELHQLVAGLGGAGWLVAGARDHAALDLAPAPAPAPALTAATSTTSQQQQQLSPPEGGLSPGAPMPPPSHADPPSGSAGPYSPANVVKPSALHPSPSSTLPGGRAAPPPRELPGGGVSSPSQPLALDTPYYSLALLRNAAPGMGTPPPPLHHPNNTTPPRLTHPHPHPTPIIVGDVAYVGGECVRLRHVKAKGEGGERANIPVAPPRFKRNSSVGCLQYGTPDPNTPPGAILQEWRLSGLRDNGQQQGVMGQQGQAGREDEGPPPPSTHKTSTYEFLDPPAAAPAPMPHPHPPFPHPHYVPLPAPKSLPRQTQPQRQASAPQIPEEDWRGRREDTRREDTPAADSSSDTSDEEGIFHKFSAPSIFRKWRTGGGGKQTAVAAPGSPKSTFYASHTEAAEPPSSAALQSPTSPKPLARALGKLRLNSRSVAANFKSYLSQRSGGQGDPEAADDTEGRVNGHPSEGVPPPAAWSAAQKSGGFVGGSSATPTAFTQVLHDYKYPKAIPKKLGGPRDMPPSLRGPGTYGGTGDDDDSCVRARPDQPAPRQQYL